MHFRTSIFFKEFNWNISQLDACMDDIIKPLCLMETCLLLKILTDIGIGYSFVLFRFDGVRVVYV